MPCKGPRRSVAGACGVVVYSVDRWDFWWHAQELAKLDERELAEWHAAAIGNDAPFPGFWRIAFGKVSTWRPLATWDDGEGLPIALIGRRDGNAGPYKPELISPIIAWDNLRCWQHAVSEQQYRDAMAIGHFWDALPASNLQPEPGVAVRDVRLAAPIGPFDKGNRIKGGAS